MTVDERIEQLLKAVESHDQQIEQQSANIDQLTSRLEQQSANIDQLTSRFDSLVSETNRVILRIAEKQERNEAAIESLSDAVGRLTKIALDDRAEIRRIWEYLLSQSGNGHRP
jgi:ABC-type transporter Mla subunit MlaD